MSQGYRWAWNACVRLPLRTRDPNIIYGLGGCHDSCRSTAFVCYWHSKYSNREWQGKQLARGQQPSTRIDSSLIRCAKERFPTSVFGTPRGAMGEQSSIPALSAGRVIGHVSHNPSYCTLWVLNRSYHLHDMETCKGSIKKGDTLKGHFKPEWSPNSSLLLSFGQMKTKWPNLHRKLSGWLTSAPVCTGVVLIVMRGCICEILLLFYIQHHYVKGNIVYVLKTYLSTKSGL